MLTHLENKKVIKILGKKYSSKIIPHLAKKNIVNSDGNEYAAGSIQKIVNRERENLSVEIAILQLVKATEIQLQKVAEKRKLLTAKK